MINQKLDITMKNLFYWIILATLVSACREDSDDSELALPSVLLLSGHRFEMPAEGGTFAVETYSPTGCRVAIASDCYTWVSETDALPGASDAIRHFRVEENGGEENRSGYIVFGNDAMKDTVYVAQAGSTREEPEVPRESLLSLSAHRFEVPAEGGKFAVKVECDGEYVVEIPSVFRPWLSKALNPKRDVCHFTAVANPAYEVRTGYVVFVGETSTDTVHVEQAAAKEPEEPETSGLLVVKREYEVPAAGGSISVEVKEINGCLVEIPAEYRTWIKESQKSNSANTLYFTVDAHQGIFKRTGYIIVRNDEWNEKVYIIQSAYRATTFSWGEDFTENITEGCDLAMVYVKGGSFMMGDDSYQYSQPAHPVTLSDYYICKFEVTQRLWEVVMEESVPTHFLTLGQKLYPDDYNLDYPMRYINWYEAQDFCKRLSELTGRRYVLPTEAQWEYAARGGKQSKGYQYSGSDNSEEVNSYYDNPVGSKKPNELGIYDMSGSVSEWCQDWYHVGYYENSPLHDPQGPSKGEERMYRAGRPSIYERSKSVPEGHWYNSGFRVVLLP